MTIALNDLRRTFGYEFTLDTETAMAPLCFQPGQWRLLQLANEQDACWFDVTTLSVDEFTLLKGFLEDERNVVTGQNLAFDTRVLLANGIELGGQLQDTMIASQLLHNGKAKISHSLREIVRRELGITMDKELQTNDWMAAQLNPAEIDYALEDVRLTTKAATVLHEKIAAQGLTNVYSLECALIRAVVSMEHHGIYLDPTAVGRCLAYYKEEAHASKWCYLETLDSRLESDGHPRLPRNDDGTINTRVKDSGSLRLGTKQLAGYNLNSNPQTLAWWKYLGIEPCDDNKKATLDKKVLARFQSDEIVRLYLNYRRVEKRQGMLQKLEEHADADNRIRARFMPLATGTGRFASSNPNLQNIPRDPEIRGCFMAPPGRKIVQADYSGMELRIAAVIAKEERMIEAFRAGADIHTRTAALMYRLPDAEVSKEQRRIAKSLNFGALYGSGAKGIQNYCAASNLFISFKEAFDMLAAWHAAYPAFGKWHAECDARSEAQDQVRTVIGRRRYLYGDDNRLTTQANTEVQGCGADIIKSALVGIQNRLPHDAYLVATVHDEVLVECAEVDAQTVLGIVLFEMESAAIPILGTKVAITAEGGILSSWGQK